MVTLSCAVLPRTSAVRTQPDVPQATCEMVIPDDQVAAAAEGMRVEPGCCG